MKKILMTSYLVILLCSTVFQAFTQVNKPLAPTLLTYTESSSGLASPEWEGGRSELEFADINGDGHPDIITIGDHGNPGIQSGEQGIMVYFGDGQGNWEVQMGGDLGYGGIAAGDVNNDGLMDIGYGMHHNYSSTDLGDQLIEVALGNGTGTGWIPWDDGLASNGEDWGMFGTDFADVDNDGDLDIGSISFGCCSGIHVYLNNLDGTWTQSFGFNAGNSSMIFQFGDINNDGNMDFIVDHESGTAYFGDGTGGFNINDLNLPSLDNVGRSGPSLGDADNDGGMDLAFTNYDGGLHVYTFMEDIGEWADFSGNLPSSGDFEMTQMADMNTDGFIDLAAFGTGTFRVFLGNGQGNWTADANFSVGDPGYCQAFRVGGDADHNGKPDVVLLEETNLSWFTYQNFLHFFKENSTPLALDIRPVFPRGHEVLRPGSARNIGWISAVYGNQESFVQLDYSTTGPEGPWIQIASELPDNGSYQWIVPQENSDNCYIRYSMYAGQSNAQGMTTAPFTITDGSIGISDEKDKINDWRIYPNPAASILTVELTEPVARLSVITPFGQTVMQIEDIQSFPYTLDISAFSPGLYFLRMEDENGLSRTSKFIKAQN
ncbi:MAG: T9SS type A sorting domain-containing protein [Bacteroidales bacterium]|nr:T9SS type A sorting domain-containing protein [Bacteroidales bacterium]